MDLYSPPHRGIWVQSRKLRVVGYQNRGRERGARRRKEEGEQEGNRRGSRETAPRTQDGDHETKGERSGASKTRHFRQRVSTAAPVLRLFP